MNRKIHKNSQHKRIDDNRAILYKTRFYDACASWTMAILELII